MRGRRGGLAHGAKLSQPLLHKGCGRARAGRKQGEWPPIDRELHDPLNGDTAMKDMPLPDLHDQLHQSCCSLPRA